MKRFLVAVGLVSAVAALLVVLTQFASASGGENRNFLGVWEGIDPGDGSAQRIVISGGEDGEFTLLWYETFWTVCDGRRAILQGTGELDPDDKDVLIIDIVISCFAPDEDVVDDDPVTFQLVRKHMLLATADSGAFVDLPFFRVSNRVK